MKKLFPSRPSSCLLPLQTYIRRSLCITTSFRCPTDLSPAHSLRHPLSTMDDWVEVGPDIKPESHIAIRNNKPTGSSAKSIGFYNAIEQGARGRLGASKSPIFRVELDEEPLYNTFIKNLAPRLEREYTCSACRHFVSRYGDLALVSDQGELEPLLWNSADVEGDVDATQTYAKSLRALQERFVGKKVQSAFKVVQKKKDIGFEKKGGFTHIHLQFPDHRIRKEEPAGFSSADAQTLATMLDRVLTDYELATIRKVSTILDENKLPYASNHKASAKWLLELVEENKVGRAKGPVARHNLLYRHAASSFIGSLSQMRSGPLGILLKAVQEDLPWVSILDQWQYACDPTLYMRPQAAPSAGNIQSAEKLFQQLGLTKDDLKRRLLVQDDVPQEVIIWQSERMKQGKKVDITPGIFSAVKAKTNSLHPLHKANNVSQPGSAGDTPAAVMTFERFVTKVLPHARTVDCWLERRDAIVTFITGLAGTKPLMQWHDDEGKNLASSYQWTHTPPVESHNLDSNAWNEVRCLVPFPSLWDGVPLTTTFPLADPDGEAREKYKYYHKQKGFRYLFVLEKNHESDLRTLPLFPEMMKSEFHGVRSTIEAFAKTESMQDVEDGMAKGGFVGGVEADRGTNNQKLTFKVEKYNGEVGLYKITLFD